jgi:outer membrane receptor protein involved in Fe transport
VEIIRVLLFLLVNSPDSIAVSEFDARRVSSDVACSLTNAMITELGKHLPVISAEDLQEKGMQVPVSTDEMRDICKGRNIPLVSGEVSKTVGKYRIRILYSDFANDRVDTLVTVASVPIVAISRIASSVVRLATGQQESEYGSIEFGSVPNGAEVLIDGEVLGITPGKLDLLPFGEHSLLFSKRGYATAVKLIVIYPGKTKKVSLSLARISGSLIAPPDKAPVYLVDEIVVRGERIREDLFKVPKGIEIIDSRDIEYSGAKSVPDLLSQVAGVSVRDKTGSGVSASISIRGMEPAKYTLVTLDGIVVNRIDGEVNWGAIPIEIIKRVEVIKGGATTPYGAKAVSGVINIVTKDRGRNRLSLSSTNGKDGGWAVTLSASDRWDLWVNTNGRKGEGWREEEKHDIRAFYGKFSFPIYEKNSVIFSLDAVKQKNFFPGGLTDKQLEDNRMQSGDDWEEKLWESIRLTSQYEAKPRNSKFLLKFHTTPQEYQSKGADKTWLLKGLDISTSAEYSTKNFSIVTEGELTSVLRRVRSRTPDTCIFDDNSQNFVFRALLEWEEKLFNVLSFTSGAKYEWIGYRIQDRKTPPFNTVPIEVANLSPKFGLVWSSNPCDIYSSFERSIRPPKPYEKAKDIALKPEVAASMEVGTRIRKYPFTASFAAFHIDLLDQILLTGTSFENDTLGAFHRGVEGEANCRLTENLSVFVNHTQMEAKFKDTELSVPQVPTSEGAAGVRITYMPAYSLVVSHKWFGRSQIDRLNQLGWLGAYELFDFYFKFKPHPSFSFGLSVTNFVDVEANSFAYELNGTARYYPLAPRGFRVEGSFEF